MVKVALEDVGDDEDLLNYVSDDSDIEGSLEQKMAEMEAPVQPEPAKNRCVIVIGVPSVSSDRAKKLYVVLQKRLLSEFQSNYHAGTIQKLNLDMPTDATGSTTGLAIVTMSTDVEADRAAKIWNGIQLDAKHQFRAAVWVDIEKITSRPDSFQVADTVRGFSREETRWWLEDERSRAQFMLRRSQETEVHWHDPVDGASKLIHNGRSDNEAVKKVWTDLRVQWSTLGTYVASFHRQGIVLWGGPSFEKKIRFEHRNVKYLEFSPQESYCATWDNSPSTARQDNTVRIWRVLTGTMLRAFPMPTNTLTGSGVRYVTWSYDDQYCAMLFDGELHVFEAHSMTLLSDGEKMTPLKYSLEKFDWSPAAPILAIWAPGSIDTPGRLLLVEIPSREEVATKNVYSVGEASLHWQTEGRVLCLRAATTRKTGKKGRKELTQLELFRMREKNIPVDTVTISDFPVKQFHWEDGPNGRFGIIVRDDVTQMQQIRCYQVSQAGTHRDTVLLSTMELPHSMNYMTWSPSGNHFVVGSIDRLSGGGAPSSTGGSLLFCALTENNQVEILHKDEHYMVNTIRWSPCGRYVITAVCIPFGVTSTANLRLEQWSGYMVWTFQGKNQYQVTTEKLYQIIWRPNPPSLMKPSQVEDIRRGIKEYARRFEEADEALRGIHRGARQQARQTITNSFEDLLHQLNRWMKTQPTYQAWVAEQQGANDLAKWDIRETCNEEEIEYREEVVAV